MFKFYTWVFNPVDAYFQYMLRVGHIHCFLSSLTGIVKAVGGWIGGSSTAKAIGSSLITDTASNLLKQRSADKQMAFQEQMSNTSYQRAMQDMQAAGLNPMLVSKLGGASTPTGAMSNPELADAYAASNTAKNIQAQTVNTKVNSAKTGVETQVAKNNYRLEKAINDEILNDPIKIESLANRKVFGESTVAATTGRAVAAAKDLIRKVEEKIPEAVKQDIKEIKQEKQKQVSKGTRQQQDARGRRQSQRSAYMRMR